jgi:hypothetical protein
MKPSNLTFKYDLPIGESVTGTVHGLPGHDRYVVLSTDEQKRTGCYCLAPGGRSDRDGLRPYLESNGLTKGTVVTVTRNGPKDWTAVVLQPATKAETEYKRRTATATVAPATVAPVSAPTTDELTVTAWSTGTMFDISW